MRRVVVAMSGGVDSAVAAAMLAERGLDVTGVTLRLGASGSGCCGDEGTERAFRAAAVIGIPHYVWDLRAAFDHHVVSPFVEAYRSGRTPNPCIECNRTIKFGSMLGRARALGFDGLATGHHARLRVDARGRPRLLRALDASKDQSYALYDTPPSALGRLLFPCGELSKDDVRAYARRAGLPVAEQPDSQDICFVPDGDVAALVAGHGGACAPGPVLDHSGRVLARHEGIHGFTIGQRKGTGVSGPGRSYVIDLDPGRSAVVVGPRELLSVGELRLDRVSWLYGRPEGEVEVMLRYRGPLFAARVVEDGRGVWLRFAGPTPRPAPGQAAVCYRGPEVLGGGTASADVRPEAPWGAADASAHRCAG